MSTATDNREFDPLTGERIGSNRGLRSGTETKDANNKRSKNKDRCLRAQKAKARDAKDPVKQANARKHRLNRIRTALLKLSEHKVDEVSNWLDEIYEKDGANEALKRYMDLLEFSVPKLSRVEAKLDTSHKEIRRIEVVGVASPWSKADMESQHAIEGECEVHVDDYEVNHGD